MKITEQRLKEIITEEIQKENIFKKMLKTKAKGAGKARQLIQPVIDAWIQGGYEDMSTHEPLKKRALVQFGAEHDLSQALSYAQDTLKSTYDPRQQREFKAYVKTLQQALGKIYDAS